MTCTAGARQVDSTVPQRPRCYGEVCEWRCTLKGGFPVSFSYVIAGLDPAIHINKLALLLTWIPGSSPGMTRKKHDLGMTIKKRVRQ